MWTGFSGLALTLDFQPLRAFLGKLSERFVSSDRLSLVLWFEAIDASKESLTNIIFKM
jgi:hypothetical protein